MRDPIPTHFFVLVVVRRGEQVLLVHERKHEQAWYFPAGRVEPGETFVDAAVRETLEETGVPVVLEGIIRLQHSPFPKYSRLRILYVGRPKDNTPPRTVPNKESLGAAWFTRRELEKLPLRSAEVIHLLDALPDARIHPLELLGWEG